MNNQDKKIIILGGFRQMKKRLLTIALAIVMLISLLPTASAAQNQIVFGGTADAVTRFWKDAATNNELTGSGVAVGDGAAVVSTKKSVAATGNENEFEITLEVVTAETITETYVPVDALVVLVMDLSASMTAEKNLTLNGETGKTRMEVALAAAKSFIDSYADVGTYTSADVVRGLAIVGFADKATDLYSWHNIAGNVGATAAKNSLDVIRPTNSTPYSVTGTGTNVAGGLRYANNLLGAIPNTMYIGGRDIDNVHVILLSDGGPTTATVLDTKTNDYYRTTGIMPNTVEGNIPNSNLFVEGYDFPGVSRYNLNNNGTVGTSTSSALSSSISWRGSSGTNGRDSDNRYKACASAALYEAELLSQQALTPTIHSIGFTTQNYTVNQMGHWAYYRTSGSNKDELSVEDFLIAVSTTGVVHDASDSIKLEAAFRTIVGSIAADPWVVTDVMGSNIIFNGNTSATGVTFDAGTLKWDLTSNALLVKTEDIGNNTTLYTYKYSYKITLDNLNGYVAGTANDTNASTELTYVVRTNGVPGQQRTAQFTSPVIKGFDAGLGFQKVDDKGNALPGAKFGIWLDTADVENLTEANALMVATSSDPGGNVVFAGIPSGHSYYFKELEAPAGFVLDDTIHVVTVSYGEISIKLYNPSDSSGFLWFAIN